MTRTETINIWLCTDCGMVIENGTAGWGLDDNGQELGELHAARMLPGDFVLGACSTDEPCSFHPVDGSECAFDSEFSRAECDGCGTTDAGFRFFAVEFGAPMPQAFLDGYVECAIWASTDDDGEPLDSTDAELSDDALDAMRAECEDFWAANYADLRTLDAGEAGHDFWLTRNGHGAGFWDRGLGELGERLTQASKAHGSSDLYIGDDGEIHVS